MHHILVYSSNKLNCNSRVSTTNKTKKQANEDDTCLLRFNYSNYPITPPKGLAAAKLVFLFYYFLSIIVPSLVL